MIPRLKFTIALAGVLSASSFGWTISSDFEKGTVGGQITEMGTTTGKYSDVTAASGKNSVAFTIDSASEGFGTFGGIVSYPQKLTRNDQIWVRISTYFPEGFDYKANPWLKFLRQHVSTSAGKNRGYDDLYITNPGSQKPFQFIFEGEQRWHTLGTPADTIVRGIWETYEIYMKFDTLCADSGGNAVVRVWKNGRLLADITDRKTLASGSDQADAAYFFTYWNGKAPKKQTMYVDDMMMTSDMPAGRDSSGYPCLGMAKAVGIHLPERRAWLRNGHEANAVGAAIHDIQGRVVRSAVPRNPVVPQFAQPHR